MTQTPEWKIKRFEELSPLEIYQILELRSEVFVVEQNCVYQDIDGKDQYALHLLGVSDGKLACYARMFPAGKYFEEASIGRVVIREEFRQNKWGHDLMRQAIAGISDVYGTDAITISAQAYLRKFYEQHGFVFTGEEYLEDGIPHLRMKR